MSSDDEKRRAAEAAAELVESGMAVGLGTGSTVEHLLVALARRPQDARYVATSPATERRARQLGLAVEPFSGHGGVDRLDLAIDGADQVASSRWVSKGGGGAHMREKVVAAAADRFVVIVSSDKLVERISRPVALELLPFGLAATLRRLGDVRLRDAPPSPDGGALADYLGAVDDPAELAMRLVSTPGVLEHGLFPPELVSDVLVGRSGGVERL